MRERKSERKLAEMLTEAADMIPAHSVWRHFKGRDYEVVCIAFDQETLDFMVIYHPVKSPDVHFTLPMIEWQETVEWNGGMLPRFEHLLSV